jgi:hypothetical protein
LYLKENKHPVNAENLSMLPQSRFVPQLNPVTCNVCLEDLKKGDKVLTLKCFDMFHVECITRWLKENDSCPICRTKQ